MNGDETRAQQQPDSDHDRERMAGQNLRNARLPAGGEEGGAEKVGPGQDTGAIDDEADPAADVAAADVPDPPPEMPPTAEHVTADTEWVRDDEDDPDLGSGRVDAPDDGYVSDEGTVR